MNARTWVGSLCLLAGCATAHPAAAPQLATDEATIRALEEQERIAVREQDFAALERIWSPRFMVNTPRNQVAPDRAVVLDIFRQGLAHYSAFDRRIESILFDGDLAIVMGAETVKPIGNAPHAGETVERRFTNIWKQENGSWRLLARHANVIAPEPGQASAEPTLDTIRQATELGKVHFPVSCTAEAQQAFNHAVGLLHHMTYPEAKAAFEGVAERDPDCAMAYWGVAMTLFQPLWPTRPGPGELQQGWEAVQRAQTLASPTARERLYIAAADSFVYDPQVGNYWERIRRWEHASEILSRNFPTDLEARAFYALALLATAPAFGSSHEQQDHAAELLLSIQAENPLHPGASHYLIHANDVQGRERESLDVVRHYGDIAPRNPHALHMPTHIYTRLGDWEDVIEGNLRASDAALEYPAGDEGQYVWDEFPHAIEYLVYAYLQQGADSVAALQIERLRSTEHLQPSFKTAFHLASIPARYALERQAWGEAAELPPRPYDALDWHRFPWPEAVTWFARGLGAAHLGRLDDARLAHDRLQELEEAAQDAGEELFTRQIRVLRLGVSAWMAHALGEGARALEQMETAAELEVSTPKPPVTPAPTLPAYELLGELLLEQGQPEKALASFKRALQLHPQRFNSLLGAARAASALEHVSAATGFYKALVETSVGGSTRAGLSEARSYLEKYPTRVAPTPATFLPPALPRSRSPAFAAPRRTPQPTPPRRASTPPAESLPPPASFR